MRETLRTIPLLLLLIASVASLGTACAPLPPRDPTVDLYALRDFERNQPESVENPDANERESLQHQWIDDLESPDDEVFANARVSLLGMEKIASTLLLQRRLPSTLRGQRAALQIIMQHPPLEDEPRAVAALQKLLVNAWQLHQSTPPSAQELKFLIEILSWMDLSGDEELHAYLIQALTHTEPTIQSHAHQLLMKNVLILSVESFQEITTCLLHDEKRVRAVVSELLNSIHARLTKESRPWTPSPARPSSNPLATLPTLSKQKAEWDNWAQKELKNLQEVALKRLTQS